MVLVLAEVPLQIFAGDPDPGDHGFFRVNPAPETETSAVYRVTFESLWSRSVFQQVPGGDHFSGMIGGTHNASIVFWGPTLMSSPGIVSMAETGSKSVFQAELESQITAGTTKDLLSGEGVGLFATQTTLEFTIESSHPLVTLTSMIAPSPDWFVGIHGESFIDGEGRWIEKLIFDLLPYDAGSDDGTTFTSANAESSPHQPISSLVNDNSFGVIPPNQIPQPLARFTFERLVNDNPPSDTSVLKSSLEKSIKKLSKKAKQAKKKGKKAKAKKLTKKVKKLKQQLSAL